MNSKKKINKLRKAANISFILIPIMVFSIGVPLFKFIYTVKDTNNTKKILQEAAYAGALAGTYAIDVVRFQNGQEYGRTTTIDTYPNDSETKSPASFMQQSAKTMRHNNSVKSQYDCLGGLSGTTYPGSADNLAAREIVAAVEEYLKQNLNMTPNGNKAVYSTSDYSIAMKFERSGLETKGGTSIRDDGRAPYNKVTVSVVLKYKPVMLKGMSLLFGKDIGDEIVIYGTSSAKTKTIM